MSGCETFHSHLSAPFGISTRHVPPATGRLPFVNGKALRRIGISALLMGRCCVRAGWSYPNPTEPFALMAGWISVYPERVDCCLLDGMTVTAQPGAFWRLDHSLDSRPVQRRSPPPRIDMTAAVQLGGAIGLGSVSSMNWLLKVFIRTSQKPGWRASSRVASWMAWSF